MRSFLTGVHLGLLQTGYLLALQRAVSAAHETYALVLCAWLAGSLLGLWTRARPLPLLCLGLVAYLAAQGYLAGADFSPQPSLVWAPAILVSGIYSGRYFTAAIEAELDPSLVFSRETYGFLAGAILALLLAVFGGRPCLALAPALSFAVLLAMGPVGSRRGRSPPLNLSPRAAPRRSLVGRDRDRIDLRPGPSASAEPDPGLSDRVRSHTDLLPVARVRSSADLVAGAGPRLGLGDRVRSNTDPLAVAAADRGGRGTRSR